jgi:hypothetical protein
LPVFSTNRVFLGLLNVEYGGKDAEVQRTFQQVQTNFLRLMDLIWPKNSPDGPPSGFTTCTVVTGFSGSNLTTATIGCMGSVVGSPIALDTETVLVAASVGTNSLSFSRKSLVVFSGTSLSSTTLSGTNCA